MRRQQTFVGYSVAIGVAVVCAIAYALAPESSVSPESMLPADSVVYVGWDGTDRHREEWEKTAAFESLEKTGLIKTLVDLALSFVPADHRQEADSAKDVVKSVARKGFSVSVAWPKEGNVPHVRVVLHDAASFEPLIGGVISKVAGATRPVATATVRGRRVSRRPAPAEQKEEFGWWTQGGHLVLAFGANVVDATFDITDGKSPSITTSANWKKYRAAAGDFSPVYCSWFDIHALKERFGETVVQEAKEGRKKLLVSDIMTVLGVERMGSVVSRCGFDGPALVSDLTLDAPAPRTGLLALIEQKPIAQGDLPPFPANAGGFIVGSFNWSQAYDAIVKLAREIASQESESAVRSVDQAIAGARGVLGVDVKRDIFDALGRVASVYNDGAQTPWGIAPSIVISVNDATTLKKGINTLLASLNQTVAQGRLNVGRLPRGDREILTLDLGLGIVAPSLCVDKKWLVIGTVPQSVESFLQRLDGKLESWSPSPDLKATLERFPKEFVALEVSDPRPGIGSLSAILPAVLPLISQNLERGPNGQPGKIPAERVSLLMSLPPAETVTKPLFVNVSTWTLDEAGLHSRSRSSVPGPSLGAGVGTGAILVALLLPAVQAAREAARRTQSKNNLKQIGLAMHNYADVYRHFPQGTHPNAALPPEKRFSWLVDILPYVDQNAVYQRFKMDKAWDDDANREAANVPQTVYLNPGYGESKKMDYPVTHYVGLAGIGADGPTLPATSPKAGIFAYDRATRISDITDGLSNTAMTSEASKDFGPWAAGGRPTLRSLTKKPYINGPDGIGGPSPGGCSMGLADGSVRFISDNIDPKVLEALLTINGGEAVNLDAGR